MIRECIKIAGTGHVLHSDFDYYTLSGAHSVYERVQN